MNAFGVGSLSKVDKKITDFSGACLNRRFVRVVVEKAEAALRGPTIKSRDARDLEIETNLCGANGGLVECHPEAVNENQGHPFTNVGLRDCLASRCPESVRIKWRNFLHVKPIVSPGEEPLPPGRPDRTKLV